MEARATRLHLDLDDLLDPEEPDGLHDDRRRRSSSGPIALFEQRFMCSGLMNESASARNAGSAISTYPVNRPCAVCTRTCRRILNRSRTTAARLSRISDRLPPVSRWMSTAVEKNRTSSSGTRSHRLFSDSLSGRPKFCSSNAFRNSGPDRLAELVGHHLHAGAERVAGADAAREQIERLGKVLLELVQPAPRACAGGSAAAGRSPSSEADRRRPRSCRRTSCATKRQHDAERQRDENAGADAEARARSARATARRTSPSTPAARRGRRSAAGLSTRSEASMRRRRHPASGRHAGRFAEPLLDRLFAAPTLRSARDQHDRCR